MTNNCKPKLAIDIDDTIVDFLPRFINYHNRNYHTKLKPEDFHSYRWWETLNTTKKEAYKLASEFITSEINPLLNFDLQHAIAEQKISLETELSIMYLANHYELFGITNRSQNLEEDTHLLSTRLYFEELEKKGLEGLALPYDRIYFTKKEQKSKPEIMLELGITTIIDDDKDTAYKCEKEGLMTLVPKKPWNKEIKESHLIKRLSWKEIRKKLKPRLKLAA